MKRASGKLGYKILPKIGMESSPSFPAIPGMIFFLGGGGIRCLLVSNVFTNHSKPSNQKRMEFLPLGNAAVISFGNAAITCLVKQ